MWTQTAAIIAALVTVTGAQAFWVARALDAEGRAKVRESVERDGTRHRSAYRLCNFVRDALAIVVSQDGTVRFVKWHEGEVTYWDHVSTSVLDV